MMNITQLKYENSLNPFEADNSSDEKPIHEHDCDVCIFLGNAYDPNRDNRKKFNSGCGDLYWCKSRVSPTLDSVIFRYGKNEKYISHHPMINYPKADQVRIAAHYQWWDTIMARAKKAGLI